MKRLSYSHRCLLKAGLLAQELSDDYNLGHIYKTIMAFWEVMELLLRAIIYDKKKTTYEKPRKLINEYAKIMNISRGVLANINFLYELRKKAVHKPLILKKENMKQAKEAFCKAIKEIITNIQAELYGLEKIRELCQKKY